MEQALGIYYTPKGVLRGTYALVRYADDLAVFCPTQEKAVAAQEILSQWLGSRGLRLADEKTHIRHLREGFNFLAFHIRHYPTPNSSCSGYKLLIKPSPGAIQDIKRKLKGIWRKHVGSPTIALINEMNPVISGWSNYFRVGVAKEVFHDLDNFMYQRTQRYMKRRHPRKSGWWRTEKYMGRTLGRQDRWVFQDKQRNGTLRKFAWTKIMRHRLVPMTHSPDDPTLQDYWQQRRAEAAGDGVSSPAACPQAARYLPSLSPAPGKWRGASRSSWGSQEQRGHRGPRESVAGSSHLPSPNSQQ
jgi:RNA-directed DNA polymerase